MNIFKELNMGIIMTLQDMEVILDYLEHLENERRVKENKDNNVEIGYNKVIEVLKLKASKDTEDAVNKESGLNEESSGLSKGNVVVATKGEQVANNCIDLTKGESLSANKIGILIDINNKSEKNKDGMDLKNNLNNKEELLVDRIAKGKDAKVFERYIEKEVKKLDEKMASASSEKLKSKIDMYSRMTTEELYIEIKKFLESMGVRKITVDKKLLEEEFGAENIRKMILKSYLISIGNKVTIGIK